MLLFYLVMPIHQLLTFISFYLDEIFFPSYRRQEIKAPVFIIGNFRSGSTLLQRLLARDQHFSSMNIAEIYIAPTITQRKFWKLLGWVDRVVFGGRGRQYIQGRDKRWLDSIQMHKVGLFTPDEDEGLLVTIWSTLFLQFVFPVMDELPPYDRFDEELPAGQRRHIMGFYRAIIRRHLFDTGGDKIYLAKSPGHTSRIDSLIEFFPDARIIYLARNPIRLVPSALNFFKYIWDYMGVPDGARRFQGAIFRQMKYWYLYPLQRFKELSPQRYTVIKYNEFVATIEETIDRLYAWMGLPLADSFRKTIRQVVEANHAYETDNVYTLEELGLSRELIEREFGEVFDLFQFNRQADIASVMQ
ncbi:MAG: sulfotransferase [Anaerolineales bacterium]